MAKKRKSANKPIKKPQTKRFRLSPTIILIITFGILAGILAGYFIGKIHQSKRQNSMKYQFSPHSSRQKSFASCQALTITSPKKGAKISSPLTVTAVVDNTNDQCHWTVFEGQAGSIELKNATGQVIGRSTLVTQQDWTENTPINYLGTITFDPTQASEHLMLFINEENPSGQPGQQVIYPLIY